MRYTGPVCTKEFTQGKSTNASGVSTRLWVNSRRPRLPKIISLVYVIPEVTYLAKRLAIQPIRALNQEVSRNVASRRLV